MAFTAPTRGEFGTAVLRVLRDPTGSIFPAEAINDFINQGMADLSAYRPKEAREIAEWPLNIVDPPFLDFSAVFKVEIRALHPTSPSVRTITIPYASSNSDENRAGWDFFAGELLLSPFWAERIDKRAAQQYIELVVSGYQDRALPLLDEDILDLTSATDYLCLTDHCKWQGFELLTHDRALYQQWIAATNNTDVSPTQLQGMSMLSETTYQRTRSRNTMLRRVPSAAYVTAH